MLLTPEQIKKIFGIYTYENGTTISLLDDVKTKLISSEKNFLYREAEDQVLTENPELNKIWGNNSFSLLFSVCMKESPDKQKKIDEIRELKEKEERLRPQLESKSKAKVEENKRYQQLLEFENNIEQVSELLLKSQIDTENQSFTAEDQKKLMVLLSSLDEFFVKKSNDADAVICADASNFGARFDERARREIIMSNIEYPVSKKMCALNELLVEIDKTDSAEKVGELIKDFDNYNFQHWLSKQANSQFTRHTNSNRYGSGFGQNSNSGVGDSDYTFRLRK